MKNLFTPKTIAVLSVFINLSFVWVGVYLYIENSLALCTVLTVLVIRFEAVSYVQTLIGKLFHELEQMFNTVYEQVKKLSK